MSTTRYGAGASRSAVAPRNESAASSSPESSSGVTPERVVRGGEELVAVRRVARRARGGGAHRGDAVLVERGAVLAQHRDRALDRLGRERARAVDALTEAGDAHAPVERHELGVARRGAVDLGDEQADRVGADVDRGDSLHASPPLPPPRAARQSTGRPGSSPPASR